MDPGVREAPIRKDPHILDGFALDAVERGRVLAQAVPWHSLCLHSSRSPSIRSCFDGRTTRDRGVEGSSVSVVRNDSALAKNSCSEDTGSSRTPRGFILVPALAASRNMIRRIDPPDPGGFTFSGAVVAGSLVFVSGQVGTDPKTGTVPAGVKVQTENVLANIEAKLSKAGCTLKDVVKATVFLADIRGFGEMNDAYRAAFSPDFPARSTIEARLARPEFLVEIEVLAVVPQEREEV